MSISNEKPFNSLLDLFEDINSENETDKAHKTHLPTSPSP